MKLAHLLHANHILLEMRTTEHWAAIVELVDLLDRNGGVPKGSREDILTSLRKREEQISTGIGSGVAIPHTFSDCMEDVVAVFGRSKQGIDFEALDDAPVHLIILFIVPRKNYQLHLRMLSAIAKLFTREDVRRDLTAAVSCDEILRIFDPKSRLLTSSNGAEC